MRPSRAAIRTRRWATVAAVALAALKSLVTLRQQIGLDLSPSSMQAAVGDLGVWGPVAFVAIVAFRIPLGVPSAFALIGGGLVFGVVKGTLLGAAGLMITAIGVFWSARWAGRDAVEARVPLRLRPALEVAGSRVGALVVALGTAYPLSPISGYHLLAGVTGMAFSVFLIAGTLGCLGRAALYTYFGNSLVDADPRQLLLASGLVLAAMLLPLAFPGARRWLVQSLARRS